MSVLQLFKYQFRPTTLIAPTGSDGLLLTALQLPIDEGNELNLEFLPAAEFKFSAAATRVAHLDMPGMDVNLSREERAHVRAKH